MFQKPKYLWLSLIAFGIISYQCRSAILHNGPERDYGLWFRYLRYELFWGLITLVIPAGVIVLSMYSSETESKLGEIKGFPSRRIL